jgi:Protein of unknown function (DUF4065)
LRQTTIVHQERLQDGNPATTSAEERGRAMTIEESDKRLGELILFISEKSADDYSFGSIKLNKLLYYSDFLAYARWGQTITGADYWKLPEGPAPRRLVQVRNLLIEERALAIQTREVAQGYFQKRPIQLRPPNLALFRGDQLNLTEGVIADNRSLTGKQITDKSHAEWGWLLAKDKEIITPSTILLSPEALSDGELQIALARAAAGTALAPEDEEMDVRVA